MKKFRVKYDLLGELFFVQKRFLIFLWVFADRQKICCFSHQEVYEIMRKFPKKNDGYIIGNLNIYIDKDHIKYFDSAEDFLNKNSEHML